ncbi:MAG: RseA family anti-sigma factor [Porticoccaceae bacterium]|nr:RseA family anti-sigma factor [Porticoccaceae bacterium]
MSQYDEYLGESLSALMDGEASDLDTRRVLKALALEDSQNAMLMRDKWRRYQSVSSVMKGDVVCKVDYSVDITRAIAEEAIFKVNPLVKILSSSGRLAIAASVALVAVLGVQQFNLPAESTDQAAGFAYIDETSVEGLVGPANQLPAGWTMSEELQVRTVSADSVEKDIYSEEDARAYLAYVLAKHASKAPYVRSQGMLPYARMETRTTITDQE